VVKLELGEEGRRGAARSPWRSGVRGGGCGATGSVREGGGGIRGGLVGQKLKKNSFLIKIEFLNMPRLWKFAQGDLGGFWIQGFFLNSSRLLKYFRKMKYAMPCYATLGKN
jgi:hypothetical protein